MRRRAAGCGPGVDASVQSARGAPGGGAPSDMSWLQPPQLLSPRRTKLIVGIFSLLGPVVGYVVFLAPFIIRGENIGPPGLAVVAYIYGLPPALLTGLIAVRYLVRLTSGTLYVLSTTLVASTIVYGITIATGAHWDFSLTGTFAGLVCGLASAWLRPTRE